MPDPRIRFAFSSASCFWKRARAMASRLANSLGMWVPSKDLRTSRVSLKPIVATYSKNGIRDTSSLSGNVPFHFGRIIAFSGCSLA